MTDRWRGPGSCTVHLPGIEAVPGPTPPHETGPCRECEAEDANEVLKTWMRRRR